MVGVEDGLWPEWPAHRMLSWLPREFQERYGKQEESVCSGTCLTLETLFADEIAGSLRAYGFQLVLDDELVAAARGCVSNPAPVVRRHPVPRDVN